MFEQIKHNNELLAIIVSSTYNKQGLHFFTPNDLSQQLAYMKHPTNKIIDPHIHNSIKREVYYTQEVLIIREGKLRVDFYDEKQIYIESRVIGSGDVILLIKGGHGFKVLEDVEMFEVKQGPYVGDKDKTRFIGIDESKIVYNEEVQ